MTPKARAAAATLRALGWEFVGGPPPVPKWVGLAVPHTSNMDGILMVLMARQIGLEMSWMIKDSFDRPLVGSVIQRSGGVFIERSKAHGVVEQMVEQFARRDSFSLVIPPEGTRSRREYWKSGFYHIALGAKVPVVPGYLDYTTKRGGFGDPIDLTGDMRTDMDRIRAFYAKTNPRARYPDKYGPIRLREEADD